MTLDLILKETLIPSYALGPAGGHIFILKPDEHLQAMTFHKYADS